MSTNPYQLNFTLKQHTPIIHFQHEQVGSTLRATEVKPKLDRFIIDKCGGKEQMDKSWFNNYEKSSLDYKLRINPTIHLEKFYITSNPVSNRLDQSRSTLVSQEFSAEYVNETQYFANNENLKPNEIKDKSSVKLGVFSESIESSIFSIKEDLLKKIDSGLEGFFLCENFGSRQTKGFGCFSIIEKQNAAVPFSEENLIKEFDVVYKIELKVVDKIDALKKMASIYKLLKSGRGSRELGGYKKSMLFRYFVSLSSPVRWEKRLIKQKIKSPYFKHKKTDETFEDIKLTSTDDPCYNLLNDRNWSDTPSLFDYKYIRAVLGLAESFEFLADNIIDTDEEYKFKYNIKIKSNNGIDRFRSPVIFKAIDGQIYLCANAVSPTILSSPSNVVSFNLDKQLKKNNRLQTSKFSVTENFITNLQTPTQFNIGDFFDFAFNRDDEKITGITKMKNVLIP